MVIKTLYGTAKLLNEKNMSFVKLINTIATKADITEEGLKVLDNELPEIFNELFGTLIKKHAIIQKDLKENY
jgi:pyrroline-5-carboxylate reductase